MSQYLSHLANLAFNRLDMVQPRLSSRFESQDDGVAPSLVEQDAVYESALRPSNLVAQEARIRAPATPNGLPQGSDTSMASANNVVPPEQPLLAPSKAALPIENVASTAPIHPLERIETYDNSAEPQSPLPQFLSVAEPKAPILKPSSATPAVAEPMSNGLKEQRVEIQLPLLQPVKLTPAAEQISNKSRHDSDFFEQIDARKLLLHDESPQIKPKQANKSQDSLGAIENQHPQPVAKSTAVKPDAIRVKPVEPEYRGDRSRSTQALASAPVDIFTPPSIQVSIGRIDIRANQTSTPTPAKSRQPSTMSLDDYARRNGERL